ncbi:MAG: hypothetical protein A2Y38_02695 [Spirochaetes bacterium GWB1_59_5]|nr:MAG: hypothetical protein A2Y38_02695 [Spirochaetes bacterium GWB1_59_5]
MRTLQHFREIEDKMRWKGAALLGQITKFKALAGRLGVLPRAMGSHTSKSIELPVVELIRGGCRFLLRDNFHDIEMAVQANRPVTLPLKALFEGVLMPHDWDWYLGEVARCRGYRWHYWTDEEMDDPAILKVTAVHDYSKRSMDWDTTPEVKARWIKRLTDPEWYHRDWSSGPITSDEPFGPGATLFVQGHLFAQGIDDLVPHEDRGPYVPGKTAFGVSLDNYEQAENLIRRLTE